MRRGVLRFFRSVRRLEVHIYAAYAAYATVVENEWMNASIGVILIIVLVILNGKVARDLLYYALQMIRDYKKSKTEIKQ